MENFDNNFFLTMRNMSAEDKLLFTCVRQEFLEKHQKRIFDMCKNYKINWDVVYKTAELHGVAPLVYSNLKKCTIIKLKIPPEIMKRFCCAYLSNIKFKQIVAEKITKVLSFFNAKNIDVLLIKGAALDILVYDHSWATCSGDVDIIMKKRIKELRDIDISEYYSMFKSLKVFEPGYFEHHDLDMNNAIPINYKRIWDNAAKINFKGQDVFVMSPEDLLISVCINSARKRYFKLKSLCDIAETISKYDINWCDVESKAKEYRCNIIIYTSLLITKMTLGCKFPKEVLYNLNVGPIRAKLISFLSQRMSFSSLSSLYSGINIFYKDLNPSLALPYATYDIYQVWRHIERIYKIYKKKRKR